MLSSYRQHLKVRQPTPGRSARQSVSQTVTLLDRTSGMCLWLRLSLDPKPQADQQVCNHA